MRVAIVLAVLAAAACQVPVSGARCASDANCPAGQGCGLDGACYARVLSVGCARCTPDATRCDGSRIERCTRADPVCGTWALDTDCAPASLTCGAGQVGLACVCAGANGALLVDPVQGSAANATPAPTGAANPVACRFRTITPALASASQWVAGAAGQTAEVRVVAPAGTPTPVVLGAGETFPIDVPAQVALVSDDPSNAASWVIEAPDGAGQAMRIAGGGKLEGFTVRGAGSLDAGLVFGCASGADADATVTAVTVDGARMTNAISVSSGCGVALDGVRASGAVGAALKVTATGARVVASGGYFGDSARGVDVTGGAVTLGGPDTVDLYIGRSFANGSTLEVSGNSDLGIYVGPGAGGQAVSLTLDRALVRDNHGTGVALKYLPAGSSASITRTEVRRNAAASPSSAYGPIVGTSQRVAGGVLLAGAPPTAFTFQRNLVQANLGDQVGVDGGGWLLSGDPSCPSTAAQASGNTFQRCAPATSATGDEVHAETTGGVPVQAQYDYWPAVPVVNAPNVEANRYCALPAGVSLPQCPSLPTP